MWWSTSVSLEILWWHVWTRIGSIYPLNFFFFHVESRFRGKSLWKMTLGLNGVADCFHPVVVLAITPVPRSELLPVLSFFSLPSFWYRQRASRSDNFCEWNHAFFLLWLCDVRGWWAVGTRKLHLSFANNRDACAQVPRKDVPLLLVTFFFFFFGDISFCKRREKVAFEQNSFRKDLPLSVSGDEWPSLMSSGLSSALPVAAPPFPETFFFFFHVGESRAMMFAAFLWQIVAL